MRVACVVVTLPAVVLLLSSVFGGSGLGLAHFKYCSIGLVFVVKILGYISIYASYQGKRTVIFRYGGMHSTEVDTS